MVLTQIATYPLPPCLNEMINAARTNYRLSASMKKKWTNLIAEKSAHLEPYKGKVWVSFEWVLKNQKRDFDNVSAGMKYIFDGLVKARVIENDSQKYIGNRIVHTYIINKELGDCCIVRLSDQPLN